ncbi:hypothetical protein DFQ29_001891 [Apophysomyces sp. BC1021]|nr:hypothetical protein DFQ29_001891 [Apophysomyces sp. BC1021]
MDLYMVIKTLICRKSHKSRLEGISEPLYINGPDVLAWKTASIWDRGTGHCYFPQHFINKRQFIIHCDPNKETAVAPATLRTERRRKKLRTTDRVDPIILNSAMQAKISDIISRSLAENGEQLKNRLTAQKIPKIGVADAVKRGIAANQIITSDMIKGGFQVGE